MPDAALLDPPGAGFAAALLRINAVRTYVAAMCAGTLESAIALATHHAGRRQAFGRPVLDFQGLRRSLVDADTDLAALRLLAYHAARQIDCAPAEEAAARAKKFAAEMRGAAHRRLYPGHGSQRTAGRVSSHASPGGLQGGVIHRRLDGNDERAAGQVARRHP